MKNNDIEVSTTSFRLPSNHILHLLGLQAAMLLLLFLVKLPAIESRVPLLIVIFLSPIFPIWQTNIIAPKADKRIYHFQSRIIYSFVFPLMFLFTRYIEGWQNVSLTSYFGVVLMTLIYSGIFSLIIFHLKFKLFTSYRYYFIGKFAWVIPFTALFVLSATILEEGWFNTNYNDIKKWSDIDPLDYNDFKGYPDYFTHYDGGITSRIEFEFDSLDNIKYLDAICYTGQTWINPWDRGDYLALMHEAYHFNITEMVTRMARKKVREALNSNLTKDSIIDIIIEHQSILRKYQTQYDDETNHSINSDIQSEWQYRVDSILYELDAYWTSDILKQRLDNGSNVKFYRNINVNQKQSIYGSNELMPNEEKYVNHYKFVYDKGKNLKEVTYYSGGKIARDRFFEVYKIKIEQKKSDTIIWRFYNKHDEPIQSNNNYHLKRLIYKKNKLNISFYNTKGKQVPVKSTIYSRIYNLDEKGRIIDCSYLDEKGKNVLNRKGVYKTEFFYENDSTSLAYLVKNYDSKGKPTHNINGAFLHNYTYNQNGNETFYSEKDTAGNYIYRGGYAIKQYEYDNLGRITHSIFLDEDSSLVENNKGVAIYSYSDDRYGNINRLTKYNSNNVLKDNNNEYAQKYYKYDIKRRLLSVAAYDTGSKLIFDEDGYGKVNYTYDSLGRKKTITNLNAYDYPFNRKGMGAVTVLNYDTVSNIINGYYLKVDGERDTTLLGKAAFQELYDEKNNLIESRSFDLEGNLYASKQNTAIYRYEYDERDNKTKSSYFTEDDKPSYANKGAHINEYVYSKEDWLIERSYRDTANNLIEFDGFARIKWKHDSLGNEIETRYYDRFDRLVDSGAAIIKTKWTSNGKVSSEAEFDHRGVGLVMKKYEWDKFNNVTSVAFYTTNGLKSLDEDSIHRYQYKYKDGVYFGERYLDRDGNLIEFENVAFSHLTIDSRGNVETKTTYDRFSIPVHKKGNEFAIVKYEYDDYDRIISEEYFDKKNEPAKVKGRYSIVRYKRDKSGNVLLKGFFNQNQELTTNDNEVALYKKVYNRNNVVVVAEELKLKEAKEILDKIAW